MEKIQLSLNPQQILNTPLYNKGTAFTQEERDSLKLNGFLPYHVSTIEEQLKRRYQNFLAASDTISKYIFLSSLQNRNEVLFYRLLLEHPSEMLPLVYTPTIGDVSIHYSTMYREQKGTFLSYPLRDNLEEMIQNIPAPQVDVIVVTDGERILGLGDLGIGGMAIPAGKLTLYTLFGGIHPSRTLPIALDVGTNNPHLLNDPSYIGWRHERIRGSEYDDFIEHFVTSIKKRYPNVLLQWEDFAKPHAKQLLDRYRDQICSFNDDIQGTAAVALGAILSAIKLAKSKLKNQKIALFGAGSAGIGICNEIVRAICYEEGISVEDARKNFYLIDTQGLIHTKIVSDENQKVFARSFEEVKTWKVKDRMNISLLEVVRNIHPTILIGVSTQAGAFTEAVVREMAQHVERPVIFPLSNPTEKSEAEPENLIRWTQGKVIVATGSPFPPVVYEKNKIHIAQCNNVYIFPGVGLGVIASQAKKVTDRMFLRAAEVLSSYSPILKDQNETLFPHFEELRAISRDIAIEVAKVAQNEGVAATTSQEELIRAIDKTIWYPQYNEYITG